MLAHEQPIIYQPGSGSTLGGGYGTTPAWASTCGNISHPVPTSTSYITQFRRSRFTSVATTQNQELGARIGAADGVCAWRGNASQRGGFYFSCRFVINSFPANNNIRMFVGLTAQTSAGVCISTGIPNNTIGLWVDEFQAGKLNTIARDTTGTSVVNLQNAPLFATGILYEWVMIANPNQGVVVTQLINVGTNTLIATQNPSANLPVNTAFLAPQFGLSNVTNVTGGDCSFDVYGMYLRPNLLLLQTGTP
jgi:hypothetical protein